MLVMGSRTQTIEGITVYADHADPRQFWYLPGPVALARRNGVAQFTLIRYRPAVASAGVKGGGFLVMEVEMRLAPGVEQKILAACARLSDGPPRLSAVPFDEGTVQVVALSIQGGGGTNAAAPPPGAFVAVESVLGASKPSLGNTNNAVFSLTLSQEGSIILDQAFKAGTAPVGVIYDLKYTALTPALDVKVTANYKRIYDKLSIGVDLTAGAVIYGVPVYLDAGLDMAFEKLKQEGVISVEVINFSDAADQAEKENWALDFFKKDLMQQWFAPTLAPITFAPVSLSTPPGTPNLPSLPSLPATPAAGGAGAGTPAAGGAGAGTPAAGGAGAGTPAAGGAGAGTPAAAGAGAGTPAAGGAGAGTPAAGGAGAGTPAAGGAGAGTPAAGGAGAGTPAAGGAAAGAPAAGAAGAGAPAAGGASAGAPAAGGAQPVHAGGSEMEAAAVAVQRMLREAWAYNFLETGRQPVGFDKTVNPPTPGYDVQVTQTGESDQVTLLFLGGDQPPAVRIDSTLRAPTDRRLTLDVPGGASMRVEATYPGAAATTQEFRLYFDFDKPRAPGWAVSPPSTAYNGYLTNRTNPLDSRYQTSNGQVGAPGGSSVGADALRAWLRSTIGSPRRVTVDAFASYEGDDSKATLNQQLTERRLDVVRGIIGSDALVATATPHGFTVARTAGRVGDAEDRYAVVQAATAAGQPVTISGTLTRAAATTTTTAGGGEPQGAGQPQQPTVPAAGGGPATTTTAGGGGTPAAGGAGTPAAGGAGRPAAGGAGTPAAGGAGTPAAGGAGTPAAGGAGTPAAGGAATPAAGGAAPAIPQQPPMGVKLAFRLQKIEQIEDKTITLHYNRQSAVKRTYGAQGNIGLLASELDGPPYFVDVDLDSPFFRVLDITVDAPQAFAPVGLLQSSVSIEYGNASDPVGIKFKDITFRPGGSTEEKASFFLNPARDLGYALTQKYDFDALSGWDGEKLHYELPKATSLDRTLLVNPFRDFGFLEIRVVAGDLDADMIDSTDVLLHYEDPGHWSRDKLVTVRPGSPPQSWKLRLSNPERRAYTYTMTHHLKDGTTRAAETAQTNIPLVTVNDPFDEPLVVELFPNFAWTGLKMVIVDVTYEDPNWLRKRAQQVRFQPEQSDSVRVRFARTDPEAGAYSLQVTVLATDNAVKRLPPVRMDASIVFLGELMGSSRPTEGERHEYGYAIPSHA